MADFSAERRNAVTGAPRRSTPKAGNDWTDRNFSPDGVIDESGREHFQSAKAVVVCANGAETPRLLLMSANAQFPQGLANSSGLVGKYLMFNYNSRALGVFEHELNEYKSVQVTRIVHDFYDHDPRRGRFRHPGQYTRHRVQGVVPTKVVTFDAGQTLVELDLDFLASRLVERGIAIGAAQLEAVLDGPERAGRVPPLWDGHTAERVLGELINASAG